VDEDAKLGVLVPLRLLVLVQRGPVGASGSELALGVCAKLNGVDNIQATAKKQAKFFMMPHDKLLYSPPANRLRLT